MKIKLDIENRAIEYERDPMPPERFDALCKIVKAAIGGVVLLVGVHMVGTWAIGGALVAMLFYGLYHLFDF